MRPNRLPAGGPLVLAQMRTGKIGLHRCLPVSQEGPGPRNPPSPGTLKLQSTRKTRTATHDAMAFELQGPHHQRKRQRGGLSEPKTAKETAAPGFFSKKKKKKKGPDRNAMTNYTFICRHIYAPSFLWGVFLLGGEKDGGLP